jgi:hypothetical protein
LGTYPEISLQQAREQRDGIRKQIAGGINPSENRKAVKSSKANSASNSFEIIAREWAVKGSMTGKKKITARNECLNGIFSRGWVASPYRRFA